MLEIGSRSLFENIFTPKIARVGVADPLLEPGGHFWAKSTQNPYVLTKNSKLFETASTPYKQPLIRKLTFRALDSGYLELIWRPLGRYTAFLIIFKKSAKKIFFFHFFSLFGKVYHFSWRLYIASKCPYGALEVEFEELKF